MTLVRDDVRVPSKPVLIKPNLVSDTVELSATPVAAVRAVLDFLHELGVREFVLGEGTADGEDTAVAFERFGYTALQDDYDIRFVDLNSDDTVDAAAYDPECGLMTLRVARTVVDSYRVSVARMKTHDSVIATLAVKNLVVGSIVQKDRSRLCHSARPMNLTMARMHMDRPPDLSVIDGVVGMEGSGPVSGTAIASGVALAGADAAAVDVVGARVMGYDPRTIGYLRYLMELGHFAPDDIQVLGETVEDCATKYKDHPGYAAQLEWHVENWRDALAEGVPA